MPPIPQAEYRFNLLRALFGDDTEDWLARPHPHLDGQTPLQVQGSDPERLDELLQALIDGNFA